MRKALVMLICAPLILRAQEASDTLATIAEVSYQYHVEQRIYVSFKRDVFWGFGHSTPPKDLSVIFGLGVRHDQFTIGVGGGVESKSDSNRAYPRYGILISFESKSKRMEFELENGESGSWHKFEVYGDAGVVDFGFLAQTRDGFGPLLRFKATHEDLDVVIWPALLYQGEHPGKELLIGGTLRWYKSSKNPTP